MQHDLIVIGAGPGGYVAAIRAAQLGMNVGCIEKEAALGGTCLRVGCIPSKALLESSELYEEAQHSFDKHGIIVDKMSLDLDAMMQRKTRVVDGLTKGVAGLFKKNKIAHYQGRGRLAGPGQVVVASAEGEQTISAPHILIATGSKVARLPGVEPDGERIGTSTEALSYSKVPEHLVVIGGGVIGLELGSVWRRLGSRVTVLEYLDRIMPGTDNEVASAALKLFKKQGLEFHLGCRVTGATSKKKHARVEIDGQDPIECNKVLLCTGRVPMTDGLGLESVGIELDKRGRIPVSADFKTSADGIYAIGDVIEGPMLAHKAEEEGIACVEQIATGHSHVDYNAIPSVAYTHPEIAFVGKTEEQLTDEGVEYSKGKFTFFANGRAKALNQTDGFVKVLADAKTDRLLGVHIIGPRAGDLIAEAATAMTFGASSEDVARACHAHPTLSEVLKEACMAVTTGAIHS
ncbi:dihydrolipoyl dehydrogenase [Aeoliella sp. ICT_H6.2]|uniref:Dihydrolipoyl dehydrogenase n=1 Tax=Aeoliella straminimaris TaxID=2954799 RepID=A0A9X2JGE6_9BACT|nr:dihydrolipoyl dehydrogenase [Aeoliella straminimaris]MCO6043453.1 dihydrolipoyl dehydrogenase [Aeoliella straminimaris]